MVVSPGTAGEAFGIYPGGQSGNPGSKFYANFIDDWGKGKYYNLLLLKPNEQHSRILYIQRCAP
jgi:penicillin amidase